MGGTSVLGGRELCERRLALASEACGGGDARAASSRDRGGGRPRHLTTIYMPLGEGSTTSAASSMPESPVASQYPEKVSQVTQANGLLR